MLYLRTLLFVYFIYSSLHLLFSELLIFPPLSSSFGNYKFVFCKTCFFNAHLLFPLQKMFHCGHFQKGPNKEYYEIFWAPLLSFDSYQHLFQSWFHAALCFVCALGLEFFFKANSSHNVASPISFSTNCL